MSKTLIFISKKSSDQILFYFPGNAKINLTQSNNVDEEDDAVTIDIQEAVNLNFALRLK